MANIWKQKWKKGKYALIANFGMSDKAKTNKKFLILQGFGTKKEVDKEYQLLASEGVHVEKYSPEDNWIDNFPKKQNKG